MKPASRNRFLASLALAFASFTVAVSADTVTVPLSPVADARIFDADWGRDNNDGAGGDLGIYQSRDRSLLRFDFSQLPAGSSISAANLNLTVTGTFGGNPSGESMNAYRLTQAWTEGGVTWNKYDGTTAWATAGGDYNGTVRASSTANAGVGQAVTWDVTTLAQDWANNTSPNQGLIIINSGTTNGLHFAAKENSNGTYRPYLATTITTPTAPPSGTWTWNGGGGVIGPVDGSGTWTDAGKWWNGAAVATWADGNDAIFGAGGAAGTVTVSGTVAPKSLWFQATSSGNYSLTGGTIDLGGAFRIVQTNVNASIVSALTNGGLIKQGGGTLSLTSTGMSGAPVNTFTAGTVISGGTIEIYGRSADNGGYTSLGTGPVTINSGATLVSASDWTTGNEWNSGNVGTITVNAGGTWTINGAGNTVRNGLVLNGATVNGTGVSGDWGGMYLRNTSVTAGGASTSSISVDTALNTTTGITVGSGSQLNYSGTIHNQVGSTGGITKTGDGTLNLSGNNTYTGTTASQGGLIEITGGTSSIGGMSIENGSVTFSGGTTTLSGGITCPNPYVTGNLVFSGNSVVTVGGVLKLANLAAPTITIQDNADVTLQSGLQIGDWGNGIYLSGGTLRTPSLAASSMSWGNPTRWLHLDGTRIIATASSGDFITMLGLDSTNNVAVGETNGAIFDTNGNTVGINVNLVNESGQNGKLTKLGNGTLTLSGVNTYSGDTIVEGGSFALASGGSTRFYPTDNLTCNKVTGIGNPAVSFDGQFFIDLTGADITTGNTWTLVDAATVNETYGGNFKVSIAAGDLTNNSGSWSRTDGDNTWTFNQATGVLTLAVAAADPYAAWIDTYYTGETDPLIIGGTADPDNDGIANLVEYVLKDGDPSTSSTGILPTLNASGANFVFTFFSRAAATGVTQVFGSSTTLGAGSWTSLAIPGGAGVAVTPDTPTPGIDQVIITVPKAGNTKLFGRLQVVK